MVEINREEHIKISSAAGKRRNHCQHVEVPLLGKKYIRTPFFPEPAELGMG